jgi:SlyX protein
MPDHRISEEKLINLEVEIAHQSHKVEELSDVVANQAREIDVLTRRVRMLMERLAEQDLATGSSVPLSDQKPPHW